MPVPSMLANFPRERFAYLPTPFEPLFRLSKRLGGPDIWIKRDDCTGLTGGGNKARKLEFLFGEALALKSDVVITAGAIQSNHARQVAGAAARFGLRCILVLSDTVAGRGSAYRNNGNILIDRLLGAEIHLIEAEVESAPVMEALAHQERTNDGTPFIIPVGGSNAVGTLGYIDGFSELHTQFGATGLEFSSILMPTGSAGTQAGLLLGAALNRWSGNVWGVSVGGAAEAQGVKVRNVLQTTTALLNQPNVLPAASRVLVEDRFVGAGYGQPDEATIKAIRLAAETEGLLLDPVYSGKAMAALIALTSAGHFKRGENIVFLHTGGSQALGAYPEDFLTEERNDG